MELFASPGFVPRRPPIIFYSIPTDTEDTVHYSVQKPPPNLVIEEITGLKSSLDLCALFVCLFPLKVEPVDFDIVRLLSAWSIPILPLSSLTSFM